MNDVRPVARTHSVAACGYELFVRELDGAREMGVSPAPARLLVHNALSSSAIWEPALPFFARGARVIAPDLPGHGRSSALPPGAFAPDMPRILAALLEACDVAQADVIGASRGGAFSLALAARFPRRVRRLVLVGATGMPQRLSPRGTLRARYGELVYDRALMNEVREQFAADGTRAVEYERRRAASLTSADRREGLVPLLPLVRCRTLLVWGEHDRHVPLAWGEMLRDSLPDARLVVMPGVAHLPHYEAPEKFAELTNDFLAAS
jgi:2-hydroxymuconate-semialdehyde hydrolase